MISYRPFFETLKKKGITQYNLIFKQGFTGSTIQRMRAGEHITTETIETLCFILDCRVEDIVEYIPDEE